jgi:hypothetical protein
MVVTRSMAREQERKKNMEEHMNIRCGNLVRQNLEMDKWQHVFRNMDGWNNKVYLACYNYRRYQDFSPIPVFKSGSYKLSSKFIKKVENSILGIDKWAKQDWNNKNIYVFRNYFNNFEYPLKYYY